MIALIGVGYIQGWEKEWSLGCVNSLPVARGNHYFAQPCTYMMNLVLIVAEICEPGDGDIML